MKIVIGVIMMVCALPMLFWNEGRAVRMAEALGEGRGAVVSVSSDKVDPANEGKLVHATGRARTADTVSDPVFGVSANAIALRRKVEMYQWKETSESRGRTSESTKYKYTKEWSDTLIDSTKFKVPDEHVNPTSKPYNSDKWLAGKVTLGAFTLSPAQVGKLPGEDALKASMPPGSTRVRQLREHEDGFFIGENPDQPKIGDLRVTYTTAGESDVSVVARQSGNTFRPYRAKAGSTVDLQSKGTVAVDDMFTGAEDANVATLWGARFMGFVLIAIGIGLLLKPLASITSSIPILGHLVGAGVALVAVVLSAVLSLMTIGLGWIFYRPVLGIALLIIGGGAAYGIWYYVEKVRGKRTDAAPV